MIVVTTSTDDTTSLEPFTEAGRRAGSWEPEDLGPSSSRASHDRLVVAVAVCSGMLITLIALLIASYKSRFRAWLRLQRHVKERTSPVDTLAASVARTGNELFSSSSDETLFVSPPSVLVHRQQDGSAPAPPVALVPPTPTNKRKKKKAKHTGDVRRSPRLQRQE